MNETELKVENIFHEFQPTIFERLEVFISNQLRETKETDWNTTAWNHVKIFNDFEPELHLDEDSLKDIFTNQFDSIRQEKIQAQNENDSRLMTFSNLMVQKFPNARYVVEPYFEQGTLNMVSAPPNTWKSWLLFYLSSHIAMGTTAFDKFKTEKAKVMIVNEEDSCRSVQDRFNLLGITDISLPIFFRIMQGIKINQETITSLLCDLQRNEITVIIFDSLRAVHNANENDSQEMQIIMDLFKQLTRNGITVIFTHHHRKKALGDKGDTADSARGSTSISAAISGHLSLEEDTRDNGTFLVLRHLKSKAGEKLPPIELKIIKEHGRVDFEYEGQFKDREKIVLIAKDAIMEELKAGGWRSINELIELGVASGNNMRDAAKQLVKEKLINSITRGEARIKGIPMDSIGKSPKELMYSIKEDDFKDFN